jgi:precorrin-2 dehydrogenase/sirohydrochlorin ferrochelatase
LEFGCLFDRGDEFCRVEFSFWLSSMDLDVRTLAANYSVLLDVGGRQCLVIGGGIVAERKISGLLEAGAEVTVISPQFGKKLEAWECSDRVALVKREYEPGDVKSCYVLVFAATDVASVNERVYEEASSQGIWVNVADQPELSSFFLPSVVRRGKLVLSVSTGGASPTVARKIASELNDKYGAEYELYMEFLSDLRLKVQSWVEDKEIRQRMFKQMLNWDILALIRGGTFESWKIELVEALEEAPTIHTVEAFSQRT